MVYQGGEDGHGRRIFVGNVNYEVNEDDLRDHFGKYGDISMLSAKEGFAFIEYTDPNAATDAIRGMHNFEMKGRSLRVELATQKTEDRGPPMRRDRRDTDRDGGNFGRGDGGNFGERGRGPPRQSERNDPTRHLFVGNLPDTTAEQDLRSHFERWGKVTRVKFLPKANGKTTLAAFIDFDSVDEAIGAKQEEHDVGGNILRLDFNRAPPWGDNRGGGAPPPRYDNRGPPPRDDYDRPPPRYDDYDRGPPPPRYDRYDDRGPPPRYDDRGPPPRFDDYDRGPPPRYDDRGPPPRYDDRGPPPRYDDYDRGPPPRERDYYDERRYDDRGPPPRYDDRGPPPRYDEYERGPPPRYDDRSRYDDRGAPPPRHDDYDRGPPPRYDDRGPPPRYEDTRRYDGGRDRPDGNGHSPLGR